MDSNIKQELIVELGHVNINDEPYAFWQNYLYLKLLNEDLQTIHCRRSVTGETSSSSSNKTTKDFVCSAAKLNMDFSKVIALKTLSNALYYIQCS